MNSTSIEGRGKMELYILTVLAGIVTAILIEDEKKSKITSYSVIAGDIICLWLMIKWDIISLPYYGKIEQATIGVCAIVAAVVLNYAYRLVNPDRGSLKHKQEIAHLHEKHRQDNHKTAS